ncbi:probable E3 ubiquitin-protein ligase TRIML2 isoform X3 [Canis lupus dingo]|uniref:probable E3 ubiquitin-protein ligase TRIML2 isoform X2 n=1 Tax=Canis lupus dingo TaxID=286419 RepID=UPI000BA9FD01|nr:probable E3 ubiquitin-protein ligase TRIML2 isoform X2 [Canis lupus dingo]XP_048950855.1 probable E3 ubiquitin-protein ligase TRIML2 isoform X3 [Canis lupus dingo]|eukprot:XP_022259882.1 probable E3 ubiquitin-protein ligase TRIML2 isoform X1 [Canis lupus familiaris]
MSQGEPPAGPERPDVTGAPGRHRVNLLQAQECLAVTVWASCGPQSAWPSQGEPPAGPRAPARRRVSHLWTPEPPAVIGQPPAGSGAPCRHRKLFQGILNTLKKKLEVAKSILADEQERMVMIQGEEQDFKEMIESEYRIRFRLMVEEEMNVQSQQGCIFNPSMREDNQNQLMEFATELKEKSQETLQRLNDLGKENMNKLKESEVRLSEQICSLQRITAELEKKCGEYTLALLQNARCSVERSESLLLQCLEPAQITDLSLCQVTGMSGMLKVLQRAVTLDPNTAHPCLVLSEDRRSICLRNVQQDVPDGPGRFIFEATVLGVESFTSGRHYWEVDVEKATRWLLGISEDSGSGHSDLPTAARDKVLLIGSRMGTNYTFWVFPPLKKVSLRGEQMHKVGVFLDCKYGQLSFYDVTDRSLIYNFSSLTFRGAVRPIFSLCIPTGGTNSDSLSICCPHVASCDVTVSPQASSA